ncbi:MAG: hypothetical protein K6E54_04425 [Bacteroidaceae bacterium]|nr:hypothetical protein [Bacteroidaceae bacterium]
MPIAKQSLKSFNGTVVSLNGTVISFNGMVVPLNDSVNSFRIIDLFLLNFTKNVALKWKIYPALSASHHSLQLKMLTDLTWLIKV